MPKIRVERKNAEELADSLGRLSQDIYNELTNDREFETNYILANLIELDKIELDTKIAAITDVLKKIKLIKEFNPKKRPL